MQLNYNDNNGLKPTIQCYSSANFPIQFGYFEFILQKVHGVLDCRLAPDLNVNSDVDGKLLQGLEMFDPNSSSSLVNMFVSASEVQRSPNRGNNNNAYTGFIGTASVAVTKYLCRGSTKFSYQCRMEQWNQHSCSGAIFQTSHWFNICESVPKTLSLTLSG